MRTIRFYSFKVADTFDLDLIATYFETNRSMSWSKYLFVDNQLIQFILKRHIEGHEVYIYEFGVITFIGFYEDEVREFLAFINNIDPVNYEYFAIYYEHYEAKLGDYDQLYIVNAEPVQYKKMKSIISDILSKSVALNHMENELSELFDKVDPLIKQMNNGKIKINKTTKQILGETLSFKYKLAKNIEIFERASKAKYNQNLKNANSVLSEKFELDDRYLVIESKINDLKNMIYKYYTFNHRKKYRNLFIFEVVLLAVFPMSSFLDFEKLRPIIKFFVEIIKK